MTQALLTSYEVKIYDEDKNGKKNRTFFVRTFQPLWIAMRDIQDKYYNSKNVLYTYELLNSIDTSKLQ